MRIEEFSGRLVRNAKGVDVTPESRNVLYPADGHSECLHVEDNSFWFRHRNECIAAENAAKSGPRVKPMSKHIRAGKQPRFGASRPLAARRI